MLKKLFLAGAACVVLLFGLYSVFKQRALLSYCENHPDSWVSARLPYLAGHVLFSVSSYGPANEYFNFVEKREPGTPREEECAYYRLQGLRMLGEVRSADYEGFLVRYPRGPNHDAVQHWSEQRIGRSDGAAPSL